VLSLVPVRRLSGLLILPLGLGLSLLYGQQRGDAGGASQQGAGNNSPSNIPGNSPGNAPGTSPGIGTRNNPNTFPNTDIYSPRNPELNRPIFLSGRVVMDDGSKPNGDITIKRVCNGSPHTEAHTDSKGNFSFQVGANPMSMMDASDSSMADMPGRRSNANSPFNSPAFGGRGISSRDLMGCQLEAYYPGYRSDMIDLSNRRSLDNPDVGIIVLHRLGNVQGTAISITTALAPKKARKAYEKGMQLASKGKLEDAEKHLQDAVTEYPKYAIALYELGRMQAANHDAAGARKSFEAAIAADSKYVSPYDGLALLAAQASNWQEAADRSKQAVYLNPVEYPSSWFYNALANYNLKHPDLAEKSAKEVVKLDGARRLPQVETLLAQLCADRADYAGAAQHLQAYLQLQPNAPNAEQLRQQLAKLRASLPEKK
jgi:tetratricopeptide (TPR) repeat protein